jgi:hypothetical protein
MEVFEAFQSYTDRTEVTDLTDKIGIVCPAAAGGVEALIWANGWETDFTDQTRCHLPGGPLYPLTSVSPNSPVRPIIFDPLLLIRPIRLNPFDPCNSSAVETLIPC